MRIYQRTGPGTGVSTGLLGGLVVVTLRLTVWLMAAFLIAAAVVVWAIGVLILALGARLLAGSSRGRTVSGAAGRWRRLGASARQRLR